MHTFKALNNFFWFNYYSFFANTMPHIWFIDSTFDDLIIYYTTTLSAPSSYVLGVAFPLSPFGGV